MPIVDRGVMVQPGDAVKRRRAWDGMVVESVQATKRARLDFHYSGPRHLLAAYGRGSRKLAFVPAGHAYRESHEPCATMRVVYVYVDPAAIPASASLAPRMAFEDAALADTALKLGGLIDDSDFDDDYLEALGTVLTHELVRLTATPRSEALAKGGLAAWQQRAVTAYIEEHLAEPISLCTLARLAGLSPYHFCRAFKQSVGVPPHRYHGNRRIERAKLLLAQPAASVTDIGRIVGYGETSSFTTAFHKVTGITPTAYRRTLTSFETAP